MTHNLPQFPLIANVWRSTNPVTNPPDLVVPAQLHLTVQTHDFTAAGVQARVWICRLIYFPARTDVRPSWQAGAGDNIELPAGSGRYYNVIDVDDYARGFPNEWRVAAVQVTNAGVGPVTYWPMPIP